MFQRFSFKVLIAWLLAFAILFIVKIFVAALWLACLVLWRLLLFFPTKQGWVVLAIAIPAILLFFYSSHFIPALDLPAYFIKRQQEFLALPAGSSIYMAPLTNQPISYVKALPVALNNALFKPLPGEGGKALYSLYAVEMILFWLGIAFIIWKRSRQRIPAAQQSLATTFLVFALLNLLFIGLIIPNIGSIIRYRSIFMPFVAVAVVIICQPRFVSSKLNRHLFKVIGWQ